MGRTDARHPGGGEPYDRVALAAAYQIARPFRAHINGLFVRPDPVEAVGFFQGIPPEMVDRVTRATKTLWDERARLAKQAFDEAPTADAALADRPTGTGRVTARWLESVGTDDVMLAWRGRLADLIVLAGLRSKDASVELKERVATALFHTARPVLVVPENRHRRRGAHHPRSLERECGVDPGVCGALSLLLNADRLHVLTAQTPRTWIETGEVLADYLGWHGLICKVHPMYPEDDVGQPCWPGRRS
jgi:hypothetical protein